MIGYIPALIFLGIAQYLPQRPDVRKRITKNRLWKAQFFLHPVIIGGLVSAALSSEGDSLTAFYAMCLTPFAFNFAVEPWDLPTDSVFKMFFYFHHIAPIVACFNPKVRQDSLNFTVPVAHGLLFGHVWFLHTMGNLEHWGWIKKMDWFWAYELTGFFVHTFWFWAVFFSQNMYAGISTSSYIFSAFRLLLPVLLQYIGRWGLYLRLLQLAGWPEPPYVGYDEFETKKTAVEAGSLVLGAALAGSGAHFFGSSYLQA